MKPYQSIGRYRFRVTPTGGVQLAITTIPYRRRKVILREHYRPTLSIRIGRSKFIFSRVDEETWQGSNFSSLELPYGQ